MDDEVDEQSVSDVLTATRTLVGIVVSSLGSVGTETTLAQYRTLVVIASRGPQRVVDLADLLDVAPSTVVRMCDRLVHKGLVRRRRDPNDRRSVQISLTPAGRAVVDEATARRRIVVADLLARLAPERRGPVAGAMRELAEVAGEVPDEQWPPAAESAAADAER